MRLPYAGAVSALSLDEVRSLDPSRYRLQPKVDGFYAELPLDADGCIADVLNRRGDSHAPHWARDLIGVHAGLPHARLVGELEAGTENAAYADAEKRGYPLVHLFDCLHDGSRSMLKVPQRERWDVLQRMAMTIESLGPDKPWQRKRTATHHSNTQKRGRHGQFGFNAERIPRSWKRVPIVRQYGVAEASSLWECVEAGLWEGLVVVDVGAKIGSPKAKQKVKPLHHMDGLVVDEDMGALRVKTGDLLYVVHRNKRSRTEAVGVGCMVAVAYEGFYKSGQPRFARIVKRRPDLEPHLRHLELDAIPGDLAARLRPDAMTPVEPWRRERA